ncbi:hypothetical protein MA5S0421_3163 [Mycobacteroides abscessus 5S-0421]|nr:hypothetical protein MA5S0421_3163 [Mycobacteroides abscessus 5S-0421]
MAPTAAVQAVIRVAVSAIGQPSQLCWIETVSFIAHPFFLVVLGKRYVESASLRGVLADLLVRNPSSS